MTIEVGSVLEGTVTGITKFGAFVELPDKKVGLVHISEVANEYVKDVHDFLKVQDKVNVKVLSVDDKGKIGMNSASTTILTRIAALLHRCLSRTGLVNS